MKRTGIEGTGTGARLKQGSPRSLGEKPDLPPPPVTSVRARISTALVKGADGRKNAPTSDHPPV